MNMEYKDNENQRPIVRIKEGLLEGFQENGVFIFYGIPYAAPPVGKLRWHSPQPVEPWEDARDATKFGNIAYQISRKDNIQEEDKFLIEDEDCLYLNIWTPSISADEKMPVMVWIHGGGFLNGSGSFGLYNGAELSKRGVVVITFNYRLGPIGFISHKELESEDKTMSSGNYGTLDQIAVLEWIQENISNFGGDRNNVTIFGESAGAMSVGLLSTSTRALGLFHKVICESGGMLMFPREIPYEEALRDGLEFQKALGASGIEEMRRIPAEKLIEIARKFASQDEQPKKLRFAPTLDDIIIKDQDKTLRERARIPLIVGSNKDEATFFKPMMPPITMGNYESFVRRTFGNKAPRVLESFPASSNKEAESSFIYLHTCNLFTVPVYELARALSNLGGEVYVYRFNRSSPKNTASGIGASHGEDIPYVFGNVNGEGYAEADRKISEAMMKYWIQFCKTGNPNAEGLPDWPEFSSRSNRYLAFDDDISTRTYTDDVWFNIL